MSVMLQLKVRNLTGRKHAVISDIQWTSLSLDYTTNALHLSVQQKLCKEDFEAIVLWKWMHKSQVKLLVIGRGKKPLSFKGATTDCIPAHITTRMNHGWIGKFLKISSTSILFQSPFLKMGLQKVLPLGSAHSDPSESIVTSNSGPTLVKYLQSNSIEENLSWEADSFFCKSRNFLHFTYPQLWQWYHNYMEQLLLFDFVHLLISYVHSIPLVSFLSKLIQFMPCHLIWDSF